VAEPKSDHIHGVFQETAVVVSVETVWLGLSPGRRRLRFSFQINDVKDPTGFRRPRCFSPAGGGGGYLVTGLFRVNRPFQAFSTAVLNPGFWPQKPPRAAEGLPP
jgi:hypothetical protein